AAVAVRSWDARRHRTWRRFHSGRSRPRGPRRRSALSVHRNATWTPVGRWLAYVLEGRFRHISISQAPKKSYETLIGWTAHYLTGIAFAGILIGVFGTAWLAAPRLGPALAVG
ncbi:MAG TPA: hypothetical protein DD399_01715, partial [Alcanivorax sp.]|nr:hypothetical protein [Alcanivorax sp.]